MVMAKKGLSDIVTNVLIILLVLVAISIIWFFVRPTIQQGAGSLQGANDCLTLNVEPVSCASSAAIDGYDIRIKRNVGSGALQGVKFIGYDATGNSQVVDNSTLVLSELSETTIKGIFNIGTISEVAVAPVAATADGNGRVCPENTVRVTCA